MKKLFLISLVCCALSACTADYSEMSLNGTWEYGLEREYSGVTEVPGVVLDTRKLIDESLWYRREVSLPTGDWNNAVLELKGARFRPKVYVDGNLVSEKEGGMARTFHNLPSVKPGDKVLLEIELTSLKNTPKEDASYIPGVDQWRSNVSSCLWDDVVLHLYKDARVDRLIVDYDYKSKSANLRYRVVGNQQQKALISLKKGFKIVENYEGTANVGDNSIIIDCSDFNEWTPESPDCYTALIELVNEEGEVISEYSQTVGFRTVEVDGKRFRLNGNLYRVRGGSVVWHRWVRDDDAAKVAFSKDWIRKHIVKNIKDHGGNFLRFHLGVPPERILDLCDKFGLAVQYEWNFFHGMPATYESLMEQYPVWFDMAARHPSVFFYHPYNETDAEQQGVVWKALDEITADYPSLIMAQRDVYHSHFYWWGMSANLGLYFDDYNQFQKPVIQDEFGGIYLDGNGDVGGYPLLSGAMLRWQGYNHTKEMRFEQQSLAYGKVGEYWRRVGIAGIGAFPILCSWDDGNHWFLGDVADGKKKALWNDMTVVWAEKTVSMDIWDRDFVPSQKVVVPIHCINDSQDSAIVKYRIQLRNLDGKALFSKDGMSTVAPGSKNIVDEEIEMPSSIGDYELYTVLLNPDKTVKYPVESKWKVRVYEAQVPDSLKNAIVWIPDCEKELKSMAERLGLNVTDKHERADVLLLGAASWDNFDEYRPVVDKAIGKGASVVMLDAGIRTYGKSYNLYDGAQDISLIWKSRYRVAPEVQNCPIVGGLYLYCSESPQGENCIQKPIDNDLIWENLPSDYGRLWNGIRGGLVAPAANIEPQGLSSNAYMAKWLGHGADSVRIMNGPYYAYEYCGYYGYSDNGNDTTIINGLKEKVRFLMEDMPALRIALPHRSPVTITNLHGEYTASKDINVTELIPLAVAGRNLTKTPVFMVKFANSDGSLIISQLITEGRVSPEFAPKSGLYPRKYDEVAVQFVLNMLNTAVSKQ